MIRQLANYLIDVKCTGLMGADRRASFGKRGGFALHRRALITGLGSLALLGAGAASAQSYPTPEEILRAVNGEPLFALGELSTNKVAQNFATTPQLQRPLALSLVNADGPRELSQLTGKIRLISLWAEEFPPCLHELNELAEIQEVHGDDRFEVMAILTQSPGRLEYSAARQILERIQASNLSLWIEPKGGDQVARALCMPIGGYPAGHPLANRPITTIMPCTLLLDSAGVIRGRVLGGVGFLKKRAVRTRWQTPLPDDLTGAGLSAGPTMWSDKDADPFILGLKSGVLDKLPAQT